MASVGPAATGKRSRRLPGVRVLVIDDDLDARELTRVFLGLAGAEVVTAASVADAMAALETFHPDAVLCDLMMPSEDGYSFLRRLRSRPGEAHVPVVALTAHVLRGEREQTQRAGFDAHLGKPVDPDAVLATLTLLLRR
jgi:CheY-like chemotaxis protein